MQFAVTPTPDQADSIFFQRRCWPKPNMFQVCLRCGQLDFFQDIRNVTITQPRSFSVTPLPYLLSELAGLSTWSCLANLGLESCRNQCSKLRPCILSLKLAGSVSHEVRDDGLEQRKLGGKCVLNNRPNIRAVVRVSCNYPLEDNISNGIKLPKASNLIQPHMACVASADQ